MGKSNAGFVLFTFKNFIIFLVVLFFFAGVYVLASAQISKKVSVKLSAELGLSDLSRNIGQNIGWSAENQKKFESVLIQMQWAAFNSDFSKIIEDKLSLSAAEKEAYLVSSAKYFTGEWDIIPLVYAEGDYSFKSNDTPENVAGELIKKVSAKDDRHDFLNAFFDDEIVENTRKFIDRELSLLPDIVPLPPKDLVLEKNGDNIFLRFSTTYFNKGKGPLEFIADKKTAGQRRDLERNVFQRIYKNDGGFRDRMSGTFLWHQEHLHYHFSDFVTYDLEAVEVPEVSPDLSGIKQKSTFCIRDISKVKAKIENSKEKAKYLICGKEIQGISVGWGDTYFYNYPDQILNVVDLPSGTYKLTFHVNPKNIFDEENHDNNISSAVFKLDMDSLKVELIDENPKNLPSVEHIHINQKFER